MHYQFTQIMVNEYKDIDLNGILYDQNNIKMKKVSFQSLEIPKLTVDPFTYVITEDDSSYKRKKVTDSICSFSSIGTTFIVSPKAQKVLSEVAKDNLEFYDLIIKGVDIEISDFKLVRVLNYLDCLIIEKSDLKLFHNNDVRRAKSLVFDDNKISNGVKIFYVNNIPLEIFFHQDIKDAIEKEGLTGFEMKPLSNYKYR